MTDEELEAEIEASDIELEKKFLSDLPQPATVLPPDEDLRESVMIHCDVRTLDWELSGAKFQFDVVLTDPPRMIQVADPAPVSG